MTKKGNKTKVYFSRWKRIKYTSIIVLASIIVLLIISELYLAIFNPQPYIYPRLSYSEKYRKIQPKNTKIVHCTPPFKRYYTTNQYHHRGDIIPISNKYDKQNIVLLGDSFTFGIGVNDGEEYASILTDNLSANFNIINTGIGGWGLTQQIRRFYEFGQLYQPSIVILLFCGNDPDDNLKDKCTEIENGRFAFKDFTKKDNRSLYRLNKLLSQSIIQKSNLYNVILRNLWPLIQENQIQENQTSIPEEKNKGALNSNKDKISFKEQLYNELLNLFAEDLYEKRIRFYFLSLNFYTDNTKFYQLDDYPYIKANVLRLDSLGIIHYIDINKWFTEEDFVESPVSHYDKKWNRVLGDNLAKYILYH